MERNVSREKFDPKTACYNKLVGARYYLKGIEKEYGQLNKSITSEYRSARDHIGHGTHTASTVVGSVVKSASFLGFGQGIARGGAPKARLVVYKIYWNSDLGGSCSEADIMAAFDDALSDGVNVLSAYYGRSPPLPLFFPPVSDIGSFHAMDKGVSVVFSAGNDGPDPFLVSNVSSWSIGVAASLIDRAFPAQIVIANRLSFMDLQATKLEQGSSYWESYPVFLHSRTSIERRGRFCCIYNKRFSFNLC